ncbi:MAG: DUF4272 domain-containing protein [Dactylosporangium sp.]|nr:DUF4272 domain-containing protein [Dactylosporangium sp.]NNJ63114.1 DUF4272 domain-containing protein [Dactylosporangium sp.]
MTAPLPDPLRVREHNLGVLEKLGLPLPPSGFPLVWEAEDEVSLRPRDEIEARMAVLNVVLACCFGMPQEVAIAWLLDARLLDRLTKAETRFVVSGEGDQRIFALQYEAVFALAWLLGIAMDIDPMLPAAEGLTERLPNLPASESYAQWRGRTLAAPRRAVDAAVQLDLYYCLDWAYLAAEKEGQALPGLVDSNTIGQRRWALEWAVQLYGPFQNPPTGWEEVDLSV